MHAYIIQQLIRIILFITISLPIGLKSFAQETKRFYMELDTPRNGAKAGQELELKYISTADFDLNPEKPDVPLNKNDAFQKVQKRHVQEKR